MLGDYTDDVNVLLLHVLLEPNTYLGVYIYYIYIIYIFTWCFCGLIC